MYLKPKAKVIHTAYTLHCICYSSEGQACRVPQLEVDAPALMRLLKDVPEVKCDKSRDWVEVSGSTIKISPWVKNVST